MSLTCLPALSGVKPLFRRSSGKLQLGKGVIIAIVAIAASVSVAAIAVGIASYKVGGKGGVVSVGIGVYEDSACTVKATEVNWGLLEPGESRNKTLYVKNEGNSAIALSMSTVNWQPGAAEGFITLTWNAEGSSIPAGGVRPVIVTLSVSPSISGVQDFSFDMVFQGTH